jgi:hypothetical protein
MWWTGVEPERALACGRTPAFPPRNAGGAGAGSPHSRRTARTRGPPYDASQVYVALCLAPWYALPALAGR